METLEERRGIVKELHTALRHTLIYGVGNVLTKFLSFLMVPFYTHYLTPADYGTLEILDLSMSLFGMFLTMGIIAAVLRCYAAADSPEEKKNVISTALMSALATGLVTLVIGLMMTKSASTLIVGAQVNPNYLLLSFLGFIFNYLATVPRTYLRALEASGMFTLVNNVSFCLMLGMNICFVAVLKLGVAGILSSALIGAALQFVVLSVWAVRDVGTRISSYWLRQMLVFGGPLMFSNLAVFVLNFSDRFFLQHLRSLDVVGIYAVGYKFAYMMNYLLVQPFYVMWQSRMFAVHDQPNHEKIFSRIFVLYSFVLVYAGLALSILSPEIVHVMVGPNFAASQPVVPVVVLAYVFWGIGFYVQLGMLLTNRTNLVGLVGAIAAAVNLVLNYALIRYWGMMGAAWATLLSFLALAVGSYWFSQRVFPLRLGVRRVGLGLSFAVVLYFASAGWSPISIGPALVVKTALLASFPLLLWKLRILAPAEIETLRTAWLGGLARLLRFASVVSGKAANA
jgi:O-antigen/teichoic acid export membrane protein